MSLLGVAFTDQVVATVTDEDALVSGEPWSGAAASRFDTPQPEFAGDASMADAEFGFETAEAPSEEALGLPAAADADEAPHHHANGHALNAATCAGDAAGDEADEDDEEEAENAPLASRVFSKPSAAAPSTRGAPKAAGTNAAEVRTEVVCGSLRGTLVLPPHFTNASVRILHAGASLAPLRFEEMAGKGSAKAWRRSLHLPGPGGGEGAAVGQWLSQFEAPEGTSVAHDATHAPKPPLSTPQPPSTAVAPQPAVNTEALQEVVGELIDERGLLSPTRAPDFVRLMASSRGPKHHMFLTVVLEGMVASKASGAGGLLDALVAADVLPALEAFIAAAVECKDALLLCRLLKLLAALPVSLAALQRCGLGKRASKLQKYAAGAGAGLKAKEAKEVDQAASALVAKWKAQVSSETAAPAAAAAVQEGTAPQAPASKKPRLAPAPAPPKPVRTLSEDVDMFAGRGAKPRASAGAPPRAAARVGLLSDTEAHKLASRPVPAPALASPRAAAVVAAQPVTERIAAERAARAQAVAAAEAHRAAMHAHAVGSALAEAQKLIAELYPQGPPAAPQVAHAQAGAPGGATRPSCLSRKARTSAAAEGGAAVAAAQPTEPAHADAEAPPPPVAAAVPASPAAPSLRDRKRKRKSVLWAPDAELLQVRVFTSDKPAAGESLAFPDPAAASLPGDGDMSMLGGGMVQRWVQLARAEAEVERRAADAWAARHRSHETTLMNAQALSRMAAPPVAVTPPMTAAYPWACPPYVRFPDWTAGPPAAGEDSTERAAQREREATRPPALYHSLSAVPDHPAQGPARSERPADNSNTPWIIHDAQAPQEAAMAQYAPQQQPMQMAFSVAPPAMPQQPPLHFMQQPQQPMQMQQQQQQAAVAQPVAMQWAPQQPTAAPAPVYGAGAGWSLQPAQAAPPPVQMQPPASVASTLPAWLLAGQQPPLPAQPHPVSTASSDSLAELVRSLTAPGMNASILQHVLEQANVGAQQQPQQQQQQQPQLSIPGPRPPPGMPPPQRQAPTPVVSVNGWQVVPPPVPPPMPPPGPPPPQNFVHGPPPQSAFTATQPAAGVPRGRPCMYWTTARGCRNGDMCRFTHN